MLIECPECSQRVSDRAVACPQCAFPVAEHVATMANEARQRSERASRRTEGAVDCPWCEARGFCMFDETDGAGETRPAFAWCRLCERTGRVTLVHSEAGYFAVVDRSADGFVSGELAADHDHVYALGQVAPVGHRYPQAGQRVATLADDEA